MVDRWAYDLDSLNSDWSPKKHEEWGSTPDISYAVEWSDGMKHVLIGRDKSRNVATLSGSGGWRYADCAGARYDDPVAPEAVERLREGLGICVRTTAGRYALLTVVRPPAQGQLTVDVTVWE